MHHIDLSLSDQGLDGQSGLYLTEPASNRLLLVVQSDVQRSDHVVAFAQSLTREGWNVLHLAAAPPADADAIAAIILDTLARAASRLTTSPNSSLRIVAVADGAAGLPACIATLQSHHQKEQAKIGGIVTIDAFERPVATADRMSDIATELAKLDGLATIVAAYRSSTEARRAGMAYHRQLQALDRETHYLVLADSDVPLLTQLADAQHALGREVRWLLDPVHSRNSA